MTSSTRFFTLLQELRRRRVFRVAGLYVVAVWLLMQAANILFPAWGIPDAAIRYLLWAGLLGFPVALAFGWVFDISAEGIRRTQPVGSQAELQRALPLGRTDYVILTAFLLVVGAIVFDTTGRVMQATVTTDTRWSGDGQTSAAEIDLHSVAVLPFTDMSPERNQAYFTDGISEEILNRLAEFRELKVIARTSSFAFKDSGYGIARISGLLAVNYLLQGSVRRDGQQLRISAQLVDRNGVQIWSDTFNRELGAIFALQDEIAESVAASIVPQISPLPPIAREPDLEAYQYYLMGRELLSRRPSMFARDSAEHFTRAIEIDPGYAQPYAARAVSWYFMGWGTGEPLLELLDRAEADIDMALSLQPDLGLAYAAQALVSHISNPNAHAHRETLLRRAVERDPNNVDALQWLAAAVRAQGRVEESKEFQRRALRIDPLHAAINRNMARNAATRGEFEAAERQLRRLAEMPRPAEPVMMELYLLRLSMGHIADTLEIGKRMVMMGSPEFGNGHQLWRLAHPYAMLGMVEQAEHWLARAKREQPDQYLPAVWRPELMGIGTGHVSYSEALAEFDAVLVAHGIRLERLDTHRQLVYVTLLSLSGSYDEAIRTQPSPDITSVTEYVWGAQALSAVIWAYLRTGARDQALSLIGPEIARNRELMEAGELHHSYDLYGYALAVLLSGNQERALDLLEQAVDAGWRGYYSIRRDPRWEAVREHPRFRDMMTRIKADLDLQRAQVEAIDAADNFEARLDAAIEAGSQNRSY